METRVVAAEGEPEQRIVCHRDAPESAVAVRGGDRPDEQAAECPPGVVAHEEEALERASSIARNRAIAAGADSENLRVVDVEDLPLAYLPGDARRVRVKVVGESVAS